MSGDNKLLRDIDGVMEEYLHVPIIQEGESEQLQWLAVGVLCLVLVILLLSVGALLTNIGGIFFQKEPYKKANYGKKAFKWWAFTTLVAGYVLYFVGFYWEGTKNSFLAYLFRPLLSSLEMFVSHSDLLEVDTYCKENPYYMAVFAVVHFSAVAVSASFAINCFWKRIIFWLRRKWWMIVPAKKEVNVFFGLNDRSLMLAKDFYKKSTPGNRDKMLFIDMPDETHKVAQRLSFSHIFGLFSYKSEQVRSLNGLKPVLMHSAVLPSKVEAPEGNILDVLELSSVRRIVSRASGVRLFFLSDSEEDNIKSMLNVLQDNVFNTVHPVVYCRARNNLVNESVYGVSKAEIRLVDESALSVAALKLMPAARHSEAYKAHPVRFVDVNTELGCVESDFVSMIVGFGVTGQDALRFVYEFGAFCNEDGKKSRFKCYVIDSRMEDIKGNIYREIPALPTLSDEIILLDENAGSLTFWEKMREIIDTLNYVVIALGNDEANITLAAELCQYASRYRKKGLKQFGIFVRSYDIVNETRMKRIAEYYNELEEDVISVFGTMGEIYSKEMIVGDGRIIQMAKHFYDSYQQVMSEDKKSWEKRHVDSLDDTNGGSLVLRKQGLYRKEFQDIENGIHCYTKRKLAGIRTLQDFPIPKHMRFKSDESGLSQEEAKHYRRLINLSIGEHLRWNASHYMLGYVEMADDEKMSASSSCCEKEKTHMYLTEWNNLSDRVKMYDYAVVYTTFTLEDN